MCSHCGADSTGRWRRHPSSAQRLCNRCRQFLDRHAGQLPPPVEDSGGEEEEGQQEERRSGARSCTQCGTQSSKQWLREVEQDLFELLMEAARGAAAAAEGLMPHPVASYWEVLHRLSSADREAAEARLRFLLRLGMLKSLAAMMNTALSLQLGASAGGGAAAGGSRG